MTKKIILLLIIFFSICCSSQTREIKKIQFSFSWFKSYDTEYNIYFNSNELSAIRFDVLKKKEFSKSYKFSDNDFKNLKRLLTENIPKLDYEKSTAGVDGGGFVLTYSFSDGSSTKITIRNPFRKDSKYANEFRIIDSFFDFAYSIVKDEKGIFSLDNAYEPYFEGLPIRKVSDNPIEYKLWGSVTGDVNTNPNFINFLQALPKTECIIINTDSKLSWAYQNDILVAFIIKRSNIKFANMSYLKHTREYILKIKPEIQTAKNNNEDLNRFKRNSSAITYMKDPENMDKWLEIKNWETSLDEIRKNCR